ncbi:MAG: hypothetical protein ABI863_05210 [Ginsengibacter sp.]
MQENLLDDVPQKKLYKDIAVRAGTFVGGPVVAGYMIAENFKVLGQADKVKTTWILAIISTVVIFGAAFLIRGMEKIPNYIIPFIYTLIASYIVRQSQGGEIRNHIEKGGQMYSIWRALLIGLIGLLATVTIIFILLLLTDKNLLQQ